MPIIGIGTDLVEIDRIQNTVDKFPERFPRRILTDAEWLVYKRHAHPVRFLSKRFAAKEAAAKALGTGIAQGIRFHDFEIVNDELGRPHMSLLGEAALRMKRLGGRYVHISLSDELALAQAFVVVEG